MSIQRDIRRVGAAATDLCSVACGRVDGSYERGLAPWDLAAGALIAAEAGAVVSDLDGGAPSGQFVLAATPGIAEGLRHLLRRALPAAPASGRRPATTTIPPAPTPPGRRAC